MTEIEIDTEETTFTAKQLARKVGTDPKTLRKFLRSTASPVEAVGQGGRYEFDAEASAKIAEAFKAWNGVKPTRLKEVADEEADDEEPTPKPKRKPSAKRAVEPELIDDALEELEELEPTPEDLEDLDDLFEDLED